MSGNSHSDFITKTRVEKRINRLQNDYFSGIVTEIQSRNHLYSLLSRLVMFLILVLFSISVFSQTNRVDISLDKGWRTIAADSILKAFAGFENACFNDGDWEKVDVPHNWDAYEGYRRKLHGNRHGSAWYRKIFIVKKQPALKRYFLFFEGVGSYATVWLNGKKVGYHAGGRTTFTLDVTDVIYLNKANTLAVRADHPAGIQDLPWVCGGCSDERGFSEGSQPMGIFRPVHLIVTDPVRIEPFGVHIWNDTSISASAAQLYLETEIKNYSGNVEEVTLVSILLDNKGTMVWKSEVSKTIAAGGVENLKQQPDIIRLPKLWSPGDPYLYTLVSEIKQQGKLLDRITTSYGIRKINWQHGKKSSNQLLVNGQPFFINGTADYENLLGKGHAFTGAQIKARFSQMKAAGFNAFRDAHHPHNLLYQQYWDEDGWLWWTQMGAHIWYDTPEFKKNFKTLLIEWVKERRNNPSNVMWGLQNESKIPTDFAIECTELIRRLDPTASSQRLVTTCNGGTGTDWDVPQNWTGTYGGNPATYSDDIKRQILIGEYGAWRTLDLHTEGEFDQNGVYSEERMTALMEIKIRLAEAAKDSAAGQFHWIFTSHDNPGRVQGGEGFRELDRIGPVNYKGLQTPWEEPLDVYYMFRSNYAPKESQPMVYIASHTWPSRWVTTGIKNGINVYSNCDEVELFNDVRAFSLGKRKRAGIGTHFTWNDVPVNYNILYAVGYVNGKEVATDCIVLNHLPKAPGFNVLLQDAKAVTKAKENYHYIYRVNCGGPLYKDENGNEWMGDQASVSDKTWGSVSWATDFKGFPAFFASQRNTNDPVKGSADWKLFQSFRYGREKLQYQFPLPDGEYLVELYFNEPWFGRGGGMDCTGWRLFDVAINQKIVLKEVDIWKEAGLNTALKKAVFAIVKGGKLIITFPNVAAGQAVISAIAIASLKPAIKPAPSPASLLQTVDNDHSSETNTWLNIGDSITLEKKVGIKSLPSELYGAEWTTVSPGEQNLSYIKLSQEADVYLAFDTTVNKQVVTLNDFTRIKNTIETDDGNTLAVYKKRMEKGTLTIPGNKLPTCSLLVMANPVSAIEPAYDLKPVTSYKAFNASSSGPGVHKIKVDGKERVIFETASAENKLEWHIATGVGDTYSLVISYNNPSGEIVKGLLHFYASDGTLMREEKVAFTPTKPTKNNYINWSTGTMINAGNYTLRLTSGTAAGLLINALDVQ
ncbi:MAG: malectin domain-containing carbohydrate-binding protein [Bacteroidota bacterium]